MVRVKVLVECKKKEEKYYRWLLFLTDTMIILIDIGSNNVSLQTIGWSRLQTLKSQNRGVEIINKMVEFLTKRVVDMMGFS